MRGPATVSIVIFLGSLIAGCASTVRIKDYPEGKEYDRSPEVASYLAFGDLLEIRPEQQRGVWLASVEAKVIEGDVYLWPINISSRGPNLVSVEFSDSRFPRDWAHRLYWIMNEEGFPFPGGPRTIFRKKIDVK